MKTPLHIVVSRMKRLPLNHRIAHLRALVAVEKPYSVRRNELQSLLEGAILKQLKKESRAA
jgi:hypothetical protein